MKREHVVRHERERLLAALAPFPEQVRQLRDDARGQQPGIAAVLGQSRGTEWTRWAPGPDLITKIDVGLAR